MIYKILKKLFSKLKIKKSTPDKTNNDKFVNYLYQLEYLFELANYTEQKFISLHKRPQQVFLRNEFIKKREAQSTLIDNIEETAKKIDFKPYNLNKRKFLKSIKKFKKYLDGFDFSVDQSILQLNLHVEKFKDQRNYINKFLFDFKNTTKNLNNEKLQL